MDRGPEDQRTSKQKWSRRAVLAGAAAGGVGVAAAFDRDGAQGNLFGGMMALTEAFNVSGDLWIGPDSAKSTVDPDSGRVYMASDTEVDYYGDGGSWTKMGVGSSSEPVPSVHTESLGNAELKAPSDDWQSKVDAAGVGGTVWVMPGDHPAPASTVNLPTPTDGQEGITIKGFGKGSKCKVPSGGTLFKGTTNADYDTDSNISGHVVENVFFYQDSWTNRGQIAVHFDGALQCRVEGCWFKRLVYGIKDEDTNGNSWANKYSDNDFEIVHRWIWCEGVHDPQIRGNHGETVSSAASVSTVDDTVGRAVGIGMVDCFNGVASDNEIEGVLDTDGDGASFYIKNPNNNLELSNNYDEDCDNGIVFALESNPGTGPRIRVNGGEYKNIVVDSLSLSSSLPLLSLSNVQSSFSMDSGTVDNFRINASNCDLNPFSIQPSSISGDLHISMTGGECQNFTIAPGSVGDLRLNIDGTRMGANNTVETNMSDGEIDITGTKPANPSSNNGWFIEGDGTNGSLTSLSFTGGNIGFAVIEGGVSVNDVTFAGVTVSNTRLIVRDSGTTITRATLNGLTQTSSSDPVLLEVRTGTEVTHVSLQGNVIAPSTLYDLSGSNTSVKPSTPPGDNITGAT